MDDDANDVLHKSFCNPSTRRRSIVPSQNIFPIKISDNLNETFHIVIIISTTTHTTSHSSQPSEDHQIYYTA